MGLSGTGRPIDIQKIFRAVSVNQPPGELKSSPVAAADDKVGEGIFWIYRKFENLLHDGLEKAV
jgi:hypothetical protein